MTPRQILFFSKQLKILALAMVLIGISVLGSKLSYYVVSSGPKLRIVTSEHDFGNVRSGQQLAYKFELFNDGNRPLLISKVSSSCGCTTSVLSSDMVPAGQKTEINVKFIAPRFRKFAEVVVVLSTNDPDNKQFPLRLRARIFNPLDIFPPNFNFGIVHLSELPAVQEVKVVPANERRQDIDKLTWSVEHSNRNDNVSSKIDKPVGQDRSFNVYLQLSSGSIPGPITDSVKLIAKRNGKVEISESITCIGKIIGEIAVVPDSIICDLTHKDFSANLSLEIVKGATKKIRLQLSPELTSIMKCYRNGDTINLIINRDELISSKGVTAKRISGTMWLTEDRTSIKLLAVPIIINME